MAQDPEFYELASRLPEAVLALIGARRGEPYVGRSFELKRAARRVDAVVSPRDPESRGRHFVIELYDHHDPDADITLLRKTIEVAELLGLARAQVVPVLNHTRAELRRDVLDASIGRHVKFDPVRILLPTIRPSRLRRRGGPALAVLPLVGSTRTVRREAAGWRRAIRAAATMSPKERRDAERSFMLLLAARLGASDVRAIFEREDDMLKDTATGKAMIAEAEAALLRRLIGKALQRFDVSTRSPVVRAIPSDALESTLSRLLLAESSAEARRIVGLPEARSARTKARK